MGLKIEMETKWEQNRERNEEEIDENWGDEKMLKNSLPEKKKKMHEMQNSRFALRSSELRKAN